MDLKVSQKEQMQQPNGLVDVVVSGINDFFLIEREDEFGQLWIDDVETVDGFMAAKEKEPSLLWMDYIETQDDFLEEEKDRTTFAVIRQRGMDPMLPSQGVQWAESMLSEIPVPLLMQQIMDAAINESQYVNVSFETVTVGGEELLSIRFNTIDVSGVLTSV